METKEEKVLNVPITYFVNPFWPSFTHLTLMGLANPHPAPILRWLNGPFVCRVPASLTTPFIPPIGSISRRVSKTFQAYITFYIYCFLCLSVRVTLDFLGLCQMTNNKIITIPRLSFNICCARNAGYVYLAGYMSQNYPALPVKL